MRKSNEVLWHDGAELKVAYLAIRQSLDRFAAAVRADEAEVVRCECCDAYSNATKIYDPEVRSAIRNAGKAPVLKPGMLAICKTQPGLIFNEYMPKVFEWTPDRGDRYFRPLTRAEIDEYRERAPE